jgi:hypothetical protein
MKACALKKWRKAVCDGGVVISEEDGGAVEGHGFVGMESSSLLAHYGSELPDSKR